MSLDLPPEDREYLDANFPSRWEKVRDENKGGIIIRGYPLPKGVYTADTSDLMIIVPSNYPMAAIDMFYFCPPLARKDGATIPAIVRETHFGISWQRWSRHYQWEPEKCSIISHISWVQNQLKYDRT